MEWGCGGNRPLPANAPDAFPTRVDALPGPAATQRGRPHKADRDPAEEREPVPPELVGRSGKRAYEFLRAQSPLVRRDSVEPKRVVGRDSVEPKRAVGRDSVEPKRVVGRDSVEPKRVV